MQNTIQKFRESSIAFEKAGILSENLESLKLFKVSYSSYFLRKLRTRFLLTIVYKRVCEIF